MDNLSTFGIDYKIIQKWHNKQGKKEKRKIYFDEIRPQITELLKKQIFQKQNAGIIPRYNNLALILGHDPNPSLIIANSINPDNILIIFTQKNKNLLSKYFLPYINTGRPAEISFLEIDNNNHEKNYSIMKNELKKFIKKGYTLCDVTNGKKISSVHLGILANLNNFDISYIDSTMYLEEKGTPSPGMETLFLQIAGKNKIKEITTNIPNNLTITYMKSTNEIIFNLDIKNGPFKFVKSDLTQSSIDVLQEEFDLSFNKINREISANVAVREIKNLIETIKNIVIDYKLDRILRSSKIQNLRLLVDTEVAGIPWEILLNIVYKIPLPIYRMFNKEFDQNYDDVDEPKNGLLIIIGSGENIPGFDGEILSLKKFFQQSSFLFKVVTAESKGLLQKELKNRYKAIIYFGHSVFDNLPEKTGWVCKNKEIFCCNSIRNLAHNPPDLIISNSCHSARAMPFGDQSFVYNAVKSGVETFIGTQWFLEFERSRIFLTKILVEMFLNGNSASYSFNEALMSLKNNYGEDDISLYNYVYYGE